MCPLRADVCSGVCFSLFLEYEIKKVTIVHRYRLNCVPNFNGKSESTLDRFLKSVGEWGFKVSSLLFELGKFITNQIFKCAKATHQNNCFSFIFLLAISIL